MDEISIIDGYIDEPTSLGVPPYISQYPRYITGAILDINPNTIVNYFTIDQIRNSNTILTKINESKIVIIIAGTTVPGKYLSSYPSSIKEILSILQYLRKPITCLCGPAARFGFNVGGGKKPSDLQQITSLLDLVIDGDPEIVIHDLLYYNMDCSKIKANKQRKEAAEIKNFAEKGSSIITQHPYFPDYLIAEIETYRGCSRGIKGGCSFCTEPFKGKPDFRKIEDITREIKALYQHGLRHFRIGSQPCLFSYMSKQAQVSEFPQPNPKALESLFSSIRSVAPGLKTLHIDNVNPGVVAKYPEESKEIINIIIAHHTSGDTAAFGVESVDSQVINDNNLKATEQDVVDAIKLFNNYGKTRGSSGMPELLPGINFVCGLKGETKKTYKENLSFLHQILKENLLIRRINIRQVVAFPGTDMERIGSKIIKKNYRFFQQFKFKVKMEIEQPLLKQLIPFGTILKDVYFEIHKGKTTFGRQIGSYPILVGVPGVFSLQRFYDLLIVDHGYRSVTGIPSPLDINNCPRETLESIPGIGKKRAIKILINRPYKTKQEFQKVLDDFTINPGIQSIIKI